MLSPSIPGFFDNCQVNKIMEESVKMKYFDHPNVLQLIGVCLDAGPAPYVVMPYMANGSLLHYLKKERNNIVLPVGVDDDVVRYGPLVPLYMHGSESFGPFLKLRNC